MIGGCAVAVVAGNMFAADESISYFAPYASLKGGYAYLSKRNDIKYKGGFAGAVELGISYDAWRLGLELGYKQNKVKNVGQAFDYSAYAMGITDWGKGILGNSILVMGEDGVGGAAHYTATLLQIDRVNALTGMVNVCYDYAMTEAWSIYAGLGLGCAKVSYRVSGKYTARTLAANDVVKTNGGTFDLNDNNFKALGDKGTTELSKTVFAWQLMAGVGYEFNENWKLTLGYKLFNTAKVKLFGDKKIKTPFNHTAELGLTYTF